MGYDFGKRYKFDVDRFYWYGTYPIITENSANP